MDALDAVHSAVLFAPDSVITERSHGKCERAGVANCVARATFPEPDPPALFTVQALRQFFPQPVAGAVDFAAGVDSLGAIAPAFGGDWSGVVPCLDPPTPCWRRTSAPGVDESPNCCPARPKARQRAVSPSSGTARRSHRTRACSADAASRRFVPRRPRRRAPSN